MSTTVVLDPDIDLVPDYNSQLAETVNSLPVEESAFRSYVRRSSCCICNHANSKDIEGNKIAPERFGPEVFLYQVSDVAHVKTRGAGGEDIENIVPLCRVHHNELHSHGILTFEIRYNFDLRNQAIASYQAYLDTLKTSDHLEFARQAHQRLLHRLDDLHRLAYLTGKYLSEFRETSIGSKRLYSWLGFSSFNEYITAPLDNGGLGLTSKTAYRWINFYHIHQILPKEQVSLVGIAKADSTVLLLNEAKTEEEKQEVIGKATTLSARDFNEYANQEMGRPDRATLTYHALYELLLVLLDAHGVPPEEVRDEVVQAMMPKIISTILRGGTPGVQGADKQN